MRQWLTAYPSLFQKWGLALSWSMTLTESFCLLLISMPGLKTWRQWLTILIGDMQSVSKPGNGVWRLTAGDGPPNDGDGVANGEIRIDFGSMQPLYGSAAAQQAGNGGVVVIIDALALEVVAETVGQPGSGIKGEEVPQ